MPKKFYESIAAAIEGKQLENTFGISFLFEGHKLLHMEQFFASDCFCG